jgi:hypothetical protein
LEQPNKKLNGSEVNSRHAAKKIVKKSKIKEKRESADRSVFHPSDGRKKMSYTKYYHPPFFLSGPAKKDVF